MVLNAAVQMLREADDLKLKISKFKSGTSMLQERSLWVSQQQLQKVYQKVLVMDLDYALDKKVEQDLWNIGFKQQIEVLQAISKDRKNPLRSEGQAMLSWVLQAAAGFYLCLLHQICTAFKLDLPFRRRASLLGCVEGWGAAQGEAAARAPAPHAARYICQHCLVHLGDLARYRHQLRVAHTFYRQAVVVSVHSGQPYNQLALVSWRRGRRLAAVYWHVRSLLVRVPFPPARANLARTLRAHRENKDLPVIPGVTSPSEPSGAVTSSPLDAHSYVTELIKALNLLHNEEELETAASLVKSLNTSLTALIATNSFESQTLLKMVCILIWVVHSRQEEAPSADEARCAALGAELCAGALLALLLPHYSVGAVLPAVAPALNVYLQWLVHHSDVVAEAAWSARPALWPALAHTLTLLPAHSHSLHQYENVPLPEDEELQGFVPLEAAHEGLRFPAQTAWDTYGGQVPDDNTLQCPSDAQPWSLSSEPELEQRVRAARLLQLGRRLAHLHPHHLQCTEEDNKVQFSGTSAGAEQLSAALATLRLTRDVTAAPLDDHGDDDDSDEEREPPPPVVISEADFREQVREKRVGILKPQGSLERAREERAIASTQDDPEEAERGEARRARVNIAMAAIMRKQEETSKQVKFVTPPPTPVSTTETNDGKDDKPKVIQPKTIKSLVNLPLGRKTGGILSLKDKSAGYPHLVNVEPEPKKEKEEKKDKPSQNSQNSQTYQPKRPDPVSEGRAPSALSGPSGARAGPIRLPVVNPREIDVRSAALQKQSAGREPAPPARHVSVDKRHFLNDLPPRFANQYRYWQPAAALPAPAPDDNSLFNWTTPPPRLPDYTQHAWWKPDQNVNFTPQINVQPNFYTPNLNTYQNMAYPMQNQNQSVRHNTESVSVNQSNLSGGYHQSPIGQPQIQLQNLLTSPLNNFNYPQGVSYDSTMYPQFNKLGYPGVQMKMEQPPSQHMPQFQGKDPMELGLGFGANAFDQRNLGINLNETLDMGMMKYMDQKQSGNIGASAAEGNTYSLFSGAPPPAWGAHHNDNQSLWSGPGPSPLERLLEQQKMKQPPQ